jgi:hypothetical protein
MFQTLFDLPEVTIRANRWPLIIPERVFHTQKLTKSEIMQEIATTKS